MHFLVKRMISMEFWKLKNRILKMWLCAKILNSMLNGLIYTSFFTWLRLI